ncbi:MAG: hypothetical protein ACRDLD_02195 [Thermoleophilaceae bacterium]
MPDEPVPENQETPPPEPSGPEDGTPAPEPAEGSPEPTDWQNRYESLQPEFTRVTQQNSELRQVIDLARQGDPEALEILGLDLAETEDDEYADDDDEYADDEPEELYDPRVDELLEVEHERELDAIEDHVEDEIERLSEAAGIELSDDEVDLIFGALSDPDEVETAFKKVTGVRDHVISDYVAGKRRAPQAPTGSSPSHQPNLDDPEQRREWIADQLAAG